MSSKFLIKMNNRYYSFLENQYNESAHMYNEIAFDNSAIDTYGEELSKFIQEVTIGSDTFKPFSKFNNFKLITNDSNISSVKITGVRNSQMIVTKEPIDVSSFGRVKNLNATYNITNGNIKLALSFDRGRTWNTYNSSANTWDNMNITIPIKDYTSFIDKDVETWNIAKDEIIDNGIPVQELLSADLSNLSFTSLMVAIALNKQDYSDIVEITQLSIDYLEQERTKLALGSDLTKYEAKVSVSGKNVKVITSQDYDELLVTVSMNK